ncbi:hypothetical protein KAR91_68060 [Candidatus Pacearchaeota archaeon]|nr:hypothetical protein [Candidatus Pacearchaeota archaeon]
MAELVNMKNPKPKKEAKMHAECVPSPYYEKYPYGLEISLQEDSIKKLGIALKECKVGGVGAVHAQVTIKNIRQSDRLNERTGKMETSQNLDLQITDMQFEKGATKDEHEKSQGLTKRAARNNPKKSY